MFLNSQTINVATVYRQHYKKSFKFLWEYCPSFIRGLYISLNTDGFLCLSVEFSSLMKRVSLLQLEKLINFICYCKSTNYLISVFQRHSNSFRMLLENLKDFFVILLLIYFPSLFSIYVLSLIKSLLK